MARVAVIGSGAMGLAAAYWALKAGHEVDLYEADSMPGGMAAHFDFGGLSIERFYHFVCKADQPTFDLMDELGIGEKMKWRGTSMGYYIDGKHYDWGDPVSLLKFPELNFIQKVRYGLMAFLSTKRTDWSQLDGLRADKWIRDWIGDGAYAKLWEPLFRLKFYEYTDNISAAWIWTRIKRVGTSRRSLLQEELGYIEGGSETLVKALVDAIEARGGRIHLGAPVEEVIIEGGAVKGVRVHGEVNDAERVISTVPTPFVSKMMPGLPAHLRAKYDAIENIGVVCVMLKLKRPVTPHFWLNIVDAGMEIPGIIEFSNLRPMEDAVVYCPYYMPPTHPKWGMDDDAFVSEVFAYIRRLNPMIGEDDLIEGRAGRLRYAQPVCPPNFLDDLPPVETPIAGLQVADTCFYYPEDRGIAESVRFGKMMAERL